jgi:hypothetical protein
MEVPPSPGMTAQDQCAAPARAERLEGLPPTFIAVACFLPAAGVDQPLTR